LLAQDEESGNDAIDALERKLETTRHKGLLLIQSSPDSSLSEFTTDGCSGGLSAGWEYLGLRIARLGDIHGDQPPWEECCTSHDHAYHPAGPMEATPDESFGARKDADLALKACVAETGTERAPELVKAYDLSTEQISLLYKTVANLMYRAVRLGGIPCSGLPWRWGYGWPECE
jgi:hypothetical protein